jgi:ADP-heptose:LPS heptosyltransferase
VAIVGKNGAARWHDIWRNNPIIATPQDVAYGEMVHTVISGPDCRPYIEYPFTKESGWTFNQHFRCRDYIAKLYLTPEELARGAAAREKYGRYVLIEPFTKHPNFRWPLSRWSQVVAACPDLTFVQHTHKESPLVYGAHAEPATFREACGLVAASESYVRSESGMCHAAAALGKRQVTLFGGCMDARVMGWYPHQWMIVDSEYGSPCGSWLPCDHCTKAMERITVDRVIEALRDSLKAPVVKPTVAA